MSWVTIIWSMTASACFTLAAVYLLAWLKRRTTWANLCFCTAAAAAAVMSFCELEMMLAQTPGQFGTALRWLHVAAYVVIVSLIGFVRVYMAAGRPWLAWTICFLRTFALLLNFLTGQNLNYREVTALRHIPFLGEPIAVGEGVSNPWMLLGQLSLLLFVVFVADAAITLWRRGDRGCLLVTGWSIVFFVLVGTVQSVLVLWQMVQWPYAPSFCFMGIVAMMAFAMSRDALRAKELADTLRESEQQMALATEAANLGVWLRDLVRNEIWASDQWRTLFGFTPAERLDIEKFLQRLHPDDRGVFRQAMAKATTGDGHYQVDFRVLLPDGRVRWISSRGRVEFAGGNPIRVRGISADISERKRAAEVLKQSEARFRALVEQAGDGFELLDSDGRYLEVNEATLRQLGYTREEILRLTVFDVDPLLDRKKFNQESQIVTGAKVLETVHQRKDGATFPVEVTVSSIQIAERRCRFALVRDITDRKQAEAEVLRMRAELAHVARVSTMGELAASVAHELNQPLGAIMANADAADLFLKRQPPALEELSDILADIRKDDERASEVIRRMRALLRKQELERLPLVINSVVEDVLQVVSGDVALRKMSISADLAPGLPKILGDRIHLQQVLLNLILNGMDAMAGEPRERRRLSIRTRMDADGLVEIAVMDSGHGIVPDKLPHLFEPFYTTKPNGMGMGLSISRTIMAAHHGKITAENNVSKGATFRVLLPGVRGEGQVISEQSPVTSEQE